MARHRPEVGSHHPGRLPHRTRGHGPLTDDDRDSEHRRRRPSDGRSQLSYDSGNAGPTEQDQKHPTTADTSAQAASGRRRDRTIASAALERSAPAEAAAAPQKPLLPLAQYWMPSIHNAAMGRAVSRSPKESCCSPA